ncbi:uncharacterized protein LOC129774798 [Toxorhynchites rutilus septentrionalis]|uniref:uncharacterized protein LOC129774798 n=1 Tax=Toxorhynchites rutilus septentrionalis TaxID=329112 RepID=UPI0024797036|nr:uncharacterized protein LOC129774798 [Toxorhynchites rutilus septentrionalis]
MLWSSGRRRRRLEPPCGLVHLTKWCTTLFIILESTNVGSGLIATTSLPANVISSNATTPTFAAATTSTDSSAPTVNPTYTGDADKQVLPRFEALVQPPARGFDDGTMLNAPAASDSDPLLLLGGFRFPAQLPPDPSPAGGMTGANASGSKKLISRTSPQVAVAVASGPGDGTPSPIQGPKSNLVNLGVSSSSGSSKIKSASLSLGDKSSGGSTAGGKSSSGRSSSASAKNTHRSAAVSEAEPVPNQAEGEFREIEGNFSKMFFETENLTTILSQVGSIAVLPCVVRNIGEGVVSWIRRKEHHLLTIGMTTYSSDERFNIIRSEDSEEWPLQIKYVQLRDAGLYECQVSTHPPTSIFIQLDVVEAKAEIFGPSEKYLKPGSTLRLTCRVVQSNEPPLYIFWYHNNRMINYDVHRGVNVSTESDNRYSELVITHTNTLNSGNYSCVSNNAVAASTLVHILNGENPAAMQHGDHGSGLPMTVHFQLLLTIVTYQVINLLLCAH